MAFRKLSPEVARELRRHVSPQPLSKVHRNNHPWIKGAAGGGGAAAAQATQQQGMKGGTSSLYLVLGGCVALTATSMSFPLLATWWIGNLNEKDDPLTPSQVRRGAFNNSGTKDIGKDPDWDFSKGQHKSKATGGSGYAAIVLEEENNNNNNANEKTSSRRRRHRGPVGSAFSGMAPDLERKYERDLEAQAKGEKKISWSRK